MSKFIRRGIVCVGAVVAILGSFGLGRAQYATNCLQTQCADFQPPFLVDLGGGSYACYNSDVSFAYFNACCADTYSNCTSATTRILKQAGATVDICECSQLCGTGCTFPQGIPIDMQSPVNCDSQTSLDRYKCWTGSNTPPPQPPKSKLPRKVL